MDKILIIDDDDSIRQSLVNLLTRWNYETISAEDGKMGIEKAKKENPDLIISDIRMPQMTGLQVLDELRKEGINARVIIITAHDDMTTTIQAMQKGAYDFIEKPIETERLRISIKRALENKKLSETIEVLSSDIDFNAENTIIGKSDSMKELFKRIGQVASNKVTVLIEGESGTGKELVAKAIHYSGVTKDYPFVAVNCSAITETLLESELFGHSKGAFTGSIQDKKGKFELAGEGTIFLDEISDMSPQLQVKLLRVLQEREFERVGGQNSIAMNARIIAATNRKLDLLVQQKLFREDLYYRLNVVTLELPPLRERKEDIPLLVNHFVKKINIGLHKNVYKIPEDLIAYLQEYNWIGNVRELENVLMQAIVLARGDVLLKEDIFIRRKDADTETKNDLLMSLEEIEKRHIKKVLHHFKWDKKKTADTLQISLPTLYSKIKNYSLE